MPARPPGGHCPLPLAPRATQPGAPRPGPRGRPAPAIVRRPPAPQPGCPRPPPPVAHGPSPAPSMAGVTCNVTCSVDRKKKWKVSEWAAFHQAYIEEWEQFHDNVDENDEPHTNTFTGRVIEAAPELWSYGPVEKEKKRKRG
ncbi:sulfated surface glycoprotein 185 [Setaria italica]|uniref:sulfated surface glycoprotein 185 n=1 Tax=Setaria italica TaxID=4555 RepID=UPI00035139C2|nr:sulfated surface glycoprotein 185 [Setaria italica]